MTVEDDGRGIPVEEHPDLGCSTLARRDDRAEVRRQVQQGGLSDLRRAARRRRDRGQLPLRMVRGRGPPRRARLPAGIRTGRAHRPKSAGSASTDRVGTKTTFKPDPQIFPVTKFNYNILYRRLQELAFLNRGVKIVFRDERTDEGETFQYERGILEFVEYLNRASEPVHPEIVYIAGEYEGVGLEVAMQYSSEFTENVHSYVNNICTTEGGTHVSGFRAALTRTLNTYGKKANLFKQLVPTGDDFREGLTAVISLRVPEPQFEGQTKTKLGNSEIEGIVNSAVGDFLGKFLEENPKTARDHRPEGPAGRRSPRKRPQGPAARPRTQRRPVRRRPARQAPRLHQPRRRTLRTLPGRR